MSSEVTSDIDLYNEDIERIEPVLQVLNAKVGTRQDAEGYRQEVIGRFEGIGLKTDVDAMVPADICTACHGDGEKYGVMCLNCRGAGYVSEGGDPEFVAFRIRIVGRTEAHDMDWEKFGEQIRRDTLDIGEGGVARGGPPDLSGNPPHRH